MTDLYHIQRPRPPLRTNCDECQTDLYLVDGFAVCSRGCGRLMVPTREETAELRRLGKVIVQGDWKGVRL